MCYGVINFLWEDFSLLLSVILGLLLWHYGSLYSASLYPFRSSYRLWLVVVYVLLVLSFPLGLMDETLHLISFLLQIPPERDPFSYMSTFSPLFFGRFPSPPLSFAIFFWNFYGVFLALCLYSLLYSPSLDTILSVKLGNISNSLVPLWFFVYLDIVFFKGSFYFDYVSDQLSFFRPRSSIFFLSFMYFHLILSILLI